MRQKIFAMTWPRNKYIDVHSASNTKIGCLRLYYNRFGEKNSIPDLWKKYRKDAREGAFLREIEGSLYD